MTTVVYIAGTKGAPPGVAGATPMYWSSDPAATPVWVAGYGYAAPPGIAATPIWISTPQEPGAVAATLVGVGGVFSGGVSAPVNTALPTVSPTTPVVGLAVTGTNGTWTNSPTSYAYQWMWGDTSANISGATSIAYTPVAGDVGHTLVLKVTATNAGGSNTANSAATSAVTSGVSPPVNTALPTVAPTAPFVGGLVTGANGTWTNSPTSYAYQWKWGDTGAAISGATALTYTPVAGDVGHTLVLTVTATNAGGSTPASSAATSAVVTSATWTPLYLPGLVAWYDASDASTITQSAGRVSQWNDKSGNAFNMTQSTGANQPTYSATGLNGHPSLGFNAAVGYWMRAAVPANTFPNGINEFMMLSDPGGAPNYVGCAVSRTVSATAAPYDQLSQQALAYFGTGSVQKSVTSALTVGASALAPTLWEATYDTTSDAYNEYNMGTLVNTVSAIGNPTYYSDAAVWLYVGMRQDTAIAWNGAISEIVLTTGAISTADRQKLEGYMSWKWGLQANLPAGHPYKSAAPTTASWTPLSLPRLVAWYDAQDSSTITQSGGTVSQWNDKSGHGYNAVQATGAKQPTYNPTGFNAKPAIMVNGSSQYMVASSIQAGVLSAGFTIGAAAAAAAANHGGPLSTAVGGYPNPFMHYQLQSRLWGNGASYTSIGAVQGGWGTSGAPQVFVNNYTLATDQYFEWSNGSQIYNIAAGAGIAAVYGNIAGNLIIGARFDPNPTDSWFAGPICELILAGGALAGADRWKMEGYLAWKWGTQANLPSTHPFKAGPP